MQTGQNQTQMATVVGGHKATISRDLRRNRRLRGYRPHQAHRLAQARQGPKRRTRLAPTTWQQVEALVREAWSPEQIHGRLQREHGQTIRHEWMDQYIYQAQQAGGDRSRFLRCQKTRRKRYGHDSRRGQIPNQVSIDDRPAVGTTRQRLGDWEGETVSGKGHRGVFGTLVERKSKDTVLEGGQHKTAAAVRKAVARGLRPHQARVQTMTYDNGREFRDHEGMPRISTHESTLRIPMRPGNEE